VFDSGTVAIKAAEKKMCGRQEEAVLLGEKEREGVGGQNYLKPFYCWS